MYGYGIMGSPLVDNCFVSLGIYFASYTIGGRDIGHRERGPAPTGASEPMTTGPAGGDGGSSG